MSVGLVAKGAGRQGRVGYLVLILVGVCVARQVEGAFDRYSFRINETSSLPNWAFVTDKADRHPVRGGDAEFVAPPNRFYPAGMHFVKRIAGVPGDVVTRIGRDFFINGSFVAHAKDRFANGAPAPLGPTGRLPAGHFFVVGTSPDSYDSRYSDIGWIGRERIVGVAEPIL